MFKDQLARAREVKARRTFAIIFYPPYNLN